MTVIFASAIVVNANEFVYLERMSTPTNTRAPEPFSSSFPYLVRRVGMPIAELFEARIAPYGITLPM